MAKKVFVSYDHSEDVNYKNLLSAWNANTDFDFEFDLRSPNVAIESIDASIIKGVLARKMKDSDYILVIVGEKTYTSQWIRWEIERAKQDDIKLKFAAVKTKPANVLPQNLPDFAFVSPEFTLDGIITALDNAKNS